MGNTTCRSYIRHFQEEIIMPSGFHPYRSSGYNILFPKLEKSVLKSIKDHAFPKRPSSIIRSMVSFTKHKCLELLDSIAKLSNPEKIYYRNAIDKLGFSAFEYITPHTSIQDDFDREVGDIVVISYPDKIFIQDNLIGYGDNGVMLQASLVGYFYK